MGSACWAPTLLSLVSPAAQRHEAVHERLSRPRSRRQLRLRGQRRRAPPCGQPGPPPVQPHRLEEEETHAHAGQPAGEPQQIVALLRLRPSPPAASAPRGPTSPVTLHVCLCAGRVGSRERHVLIRAALAAWASAAAPHPPRCAGQVGGCVSSSRVGQSHRGEQARCHVTPADGPEVVVSLPSCLV